jgi:hypothetical protein
MTGPIARQGPHHSAQKSTTVNLSEDITFSWKLVSVNSKAINKCFLCYVIIFYSTKVNQFCELFRRFPDSAGFPCLYRFLLLGLNVPISFQLHSMPELHAAAEAAAHPSGR